MVLIERNRIELPPLIYEKFRGKKVDIKLIDEKIVISEVSNSSYDLRGILKNKKMSTKLFSKFKEEDMGIEQ